MMLPMIRTDRVDEWTETGMPPSQVLNALLIDSTRIWSKNPSIPKLMIVTAAKPSMLRTAKAIGDRG